MARATGRYVYGIVAGGARPPSGAGIAGHPLELVPAGDTAAIVSDIAEEELETGQDELMAHAHVVERALEQGVVLPMRFGVVMPNDEVVRAELLEPYREDLLAQLEQLQGKAELHVRAVYEQERLLSEAVEADAGIAARSEALRGQPADATYYERIELGQRVAQAVDRIREQDTVAILHALAPLAVSSSVGEPQDERVAADLAFLVEDERIAAFDDAVDDLGRRNEGRLRLSYTGPLPAYSFVELPAQV